MGGQTSISFCMSLKKCQHLQKPARVEDEKIIALLGKSLQRLFSAVGAEPVRSVCSLERARFLPSIFAYETAKWGAGGLLALFRGVFPIS